MQAHCEDCGHWHFSDPEHGGYGACNRHKKLTKYHERCGDFVPDLQTIWNNRHDPEHIELGGQLRAMPRNERVEYQQDKESVNAT